MYKLLVPVVPLAVLAGCAGVYAEATASSLSSSTFKPNGGTEMNVSGATTVGFNLGVEFGSTRQRFAVGYTSDSISYTGGSSSLAGSSTQYDFNVFNIAERLKLRLGLGFNFGNGGGGAAGGIGGTYFLTWKNAVHAFVGGRFLTDNTSTGIFTGSGVTARVAISHTFGDARPDKSFVVPLDSATDITKVIAVGAEALHCEEATSGRFDWAAWVSFRCGDRTIAYHQFADGMVVTCEHEQSTSRCRALAEKIVNAAVAIVTPETPAAAPPAPPVTPPAAPPASAAPPPAAPAPTPADQTTPAPTSTPTALPPATL